MAIASTSMDTADTTATPARRRRPRSTAPDIMTTGEVARLCGVAPRTVISWADSGRLKCWRIPGSQDRRYNRPVVDRFRAEHGMIDAGDLARRVVLYGVTPDVSAAIVLELDDADELVDGRDAFAAGAAVARGNCLVVIDTAVGLAESRALITVALAHGATVAAFGPHDLADVPGVVRLGDGRQAPGVIAARVGGVLRGMGAGRAG